MGTIKVTVKNRYLHGITEEFICSNVDVCDKDEMDYCAEECCGEYLDMHHDLYNGFCPDLPYETFAEACYYMIEEVV